MSDNISHNKIIQADINQPQTLPTDTIHYYVVRISDQQNDVTELSAFISHDEIARADRFLNPQHGIKYRCTRGLLRKLLASYLDVSPQSIEFEYAEHGKPSIKNNPVLQFNMSHSHDMAAYAFCFNHAIGIDVEYMREKENIEGLIEHVGSPLEIEELSKLQGDDKLHAFYRLWTRKEAYIKAIGRGLGMGLRSIHIGTHESASPLTIEYKDKIQPDYVVMDISPPANYRLAICSKFSGV